MTATLTSADIRKRRRDRLVNNLFGELARLKWERREIELEHRKAGEIYARKLERLKVKAQRNRDAMAALNDTVTLHKTEGRL